MARPPTAEVRSPPPADDVPIGPALIGNIAAATAVIYLPFPLYFDWMHGEDESMSKRHQVWWASLHLPFHIALVLLVEGANKLFIWWRVRESAATAAQLLDNLVAKGDTSEAVAKKLWKTVKKYLEKAPPKDVLEAYQGINETITHVRGIPDSFCECPRPRLPGLRSSSHAPVACGRPSREAANLGACQGRYPPCPKPSRNLSAGQTISNSCSP